MRLAGTAHLSSADGAKTSKVGSVIQTDDDALLLWLYAYPLLGQEVELRFVEDCGHGSNEVVVLVDHKTRKPEFVIGDVSFAGRQAQMRMFSMPVFPATFMLKSSLTVRDRQVGGSLPQRMMGDPALPSVR